MKKWIIGGIIIAGFAIIEGFYLMQQRGPSISDKDYQKAYQHSNKIFSLVLPDTAEFCGEPMPIGLYYVREALDRELTVNSYWHSSTLIMLKKSKRYFSVIEPILRRNGVPEDFKYLVLAESGLFNSVSGAGAAGFWQFMPPTAKRYGLLINDEIDERYHLEKSTEAACTMLKDFYKIFNSWTLSAAAYNAGEGKIMKETERQKTGDYYSLYLSNETMRYIYRVVALKLLCEHPGEFGYFLRNKDLYPPIPTYKVSIDSSINNLVDFAKSKDINYLILKEFNPWLRSDKLSNPEHKIYTLRIPKKGYEDFDQLIEEISDAEQLFNDTTSIKGLQQ